MYLSTLYQSKEDEYRGVEGDLDSENPGCDIRLRTGSRWWNLTYVYISAYVCTWVLHVSVVCFFICVYILLPIYTCSLYVPCDSFVGIEAWNGFMCVCVCVSARAWNVPWSYLQIWVRHGKANLTHYTSRKFCIQYQTRLLVQNERVKKVGKERNKEIRKERERDCGDLSRR